MILWTLKTGPVWVGFVTGLDTSSQLGTLLGGPGGCPEFPSPGQTGQRGVSLLMWSWWWGRHASTPLLELTVTAGIHEQHGCSCYWCSHYIIFLQWSFFFSGCFPQCICRQSATSDCLFGSNCGTFPCLPHISANYTLVDSCALLSMNTPWAAFKKIENLSTMGTWRYTASFVQCNPWSTQIQDILWKYKNWKFNGQFLPSMCIPFW